ncbi:hypothetical protein [Cupriavidus sp. USMAHM13]|uniref:hypothetical protein n=1 Tax=Cupriavidus sp. USMAHM13 TaxID=1389192 RepID=UPI0012EA763C|nr:hypothetical protein [Cupriavidus sp. USMAHM13]
MNKNRLDTVRALVELSFPLDEIESRLREFDWDFEGEAIELSRAHLIDVLRRYLSRELSVSDVERWANLIEGREDIALEKRSEEKLDEVLYELANPALMVPLDESHASAIIEALSK